MNGLRNKVIIETDGKLMSGRDVAIAAMLGAEEFGFATAPLVTMGCVMMRVCNLDTCPVGVATQNPELRKRFTGKPEYVVNFMRFIAQELREIMADLGIKTLDELVGRTDLLEQKDVAKSGRSAEIDLSQILDIHMLSRRRYIMIRKMYLISNLRRQLMKRFFLRSSSLQWRQEAREVLKLMLPIQTVH